jgi:TonB family protein
MNTKTHKSYRSALKEDMPYFSNLPGGNYRITVVKSGYKRSTRDFYLYCPMAHANYYDWSIELSRGSSREIVRIADPPVLASSLPVTNNPNRVRTINGGVLNWKAASLPTPEYPARAKASKANGTVIVKVIVDEHGKVIFASTHSGDPLLRASSETAARAARFSPTLLRGESVRVSGTITYYFAP